MAVELDQLPAAVRARALAALGAQETGRRRTSHLKGRNDRTNRYRCNRPECHELEPFTSYAAAERHAHTTGHARVAIDLTPGGTT